MGCFSRVSKLKREKEKVDVESSRKLIEESSGLSRACLSARVHGAVRRFLVAVFLVVLLHGLGERAQVALIRCFDCLFRQTELNEDGTELT